MLNDAPCSVDRSLGRCEAVSAVGLTAFVAVLHFSVLTAGTAGPGSPRRAVSTLAWCARCDDTLDVVEQGEAVAANPHFASFAGRLKLTVGLAVVVLTAWLHIIRRQSPLAHALPR